MTFITYLRSYSDTYHVNFHTLMVQFSLSHQTKLGDVKTDRFIATICTRFEQMKYALSLP